MDLSKTEKNTFIAAVIVTFQPDLDALRRLIHSLRNQVDKIVVVDNGSDTKSTQSISDSLKKNDALVELKSNFGIAYAQNLGIQKALEDSRCTHILLSDQDSIPTFDMVQKLLVALASSVKNDDRPVAVAGPTRLDERTERKSFFMLDVKGRPKRSERELQSASDSNPINVMSLIASGSLIPVEVLADVGLMKEDYFIDHVDTEWCFRARQKGYRLVGVTDAFMHHRLGDNIKKVWFFGHKGVTLHSPIRNYYMFRNTLHMLRDVEISFIWKFYLLSRVLKVSLYSLVYGNERKLRLRLISLGIFHGLSGLSGKLNIDSGICEPVTRLAEGS